jgi:nitrogen fixation negative regulator NifL
MLTRVHIVLVYKCSYERLTSPLAALPQDRRVFAVHRNPKSKIAVPTARLPWILGIVFAATFLLIALEVSPWQVTSLTTLWAVRILRITLILCFASVLCATILKKERTFHSNLLAEMDARMQIENDLRQSEERIRMTIEAAKLGFWDHDIPNDRQVWSDASKAMLGLPLDCPETFPVLLSAVHPDDREMVRLSIDDSIRNNHDYSVEYRVIWPDGSVHWIWAQGSMSCDETGKPVRNRGILMNVDDRKRAEEQLRLQVAALDAAANAIVITDTHGSILWTNRAFTDLTGYTRQEVQGGNPRVLKSGKQDDALYQNLWQTIAAGKIWHGEIVNRRKDGSLYTEEMTITPVRSATGEITHFVAIKQDVSERIRVTEALQQAEEKYRTIFEDAVVGIYQSTPEGRFLSVNRAVAELCGYESPEQMIAEIKDIGHQSYVDPSSREEFKQILARDGVVRNFEYQAYRKDGSKVWFLENGRVVRNAQGEVRYFEGTMQDITERKQLEEQFHQAQKMEAVGRLAGGVAHDFNNALGVILGYSELLQLSLPAETTAHRYAEQIAKAGQKASALPRQLLAFSRKQTIQPTLLDLNSVVADVDKMLRSLIGEDIALTVTRDPKLKSVKADRGQIEQILMNLAVNARDAMPKGGKLIIETANAELDQLYLKEHPYAKPGSYVALSVSDSGCGMDKATQAHIFEPFFTTKDPGKGTGLGLSTVYGIVKQSDGYVSVYSEVGRGTTFRIYLPRVAGEAQPAVPASQPPKLPRGTETVLLVEDEESLRRLTRGCLQNSGYTVLEAADGRTALKLATEHGGSIDLLLTDVIMPGMSGRELAETLQKSRPEVRLLYMSGYTYDLVSQHGVLGPDVALLQKPFGIEPLLVRVRDVLDGKLGRTASAD